VLCCAGTIKCSYQTVILPLPRSSAQGSLSLAGCPVAAALADKNRHTRKVESLVKYDRNLEQPNTKQTVIMLAYIRYHTPTPT
jgi:hypothetical protein